MRHTIILFTVLLLAACDSGERQRLQLEELERMNRADSVMLNDSLARDLADWFDRHGTPNEQLRAYYILGRTYADRGEVPQALEAYNDAADRADTTAKDCDYYTLCRVHAQKARVYYDQLLPDNMIHEERLAMKYALLYADTTSYIYCYGMMAEGYDMKNIPDSALCVMEDAYRLYKKIGKDSYAASLCFSMADIYLKKGEIQKAKEALYEYESKTGFFDADGNIEDGREIYYYIKGQYYIYSTQLDSAEYFFRKNLEQATEVNSQMSGYKGLLELYKRRGVIDSLAKYTQLFIDLANISHNKIEMQSMVQIQAMYDYSHHQQVAQQEKERADRERMHFWSLVFYVVGSIIALSILAAIVFAA
ncbi:MAG: hypothetical protein IKN02_00640, partial [Prevotella sp.]|nr:hypothetical protein [Prevotella sp.]